MAPKLHLYHIPGSCTTFTRMVLNQAGFEDVKLTPVNPRTDREWFTKINPKGQVPTLIVDDSEMLTEGLPIAYYIMSLAPEKFKPFPMEEGLEKYQAMGVLNFVSSEMQKCIAPFYKPYYNEETREGVRQNDVRKNFGVLNDMLADKKFLWKDEYTVIDGYAYVISTWLKKMNVGVEVTEFPNIVEWMKRVEAVPVVQKTLQQEGIEPHF